MVFLNNELTFYLIRESILGMENHKQIGLVGHRRHFCRSTMFPASQYVHVMMGGVYSSCGSLTLNLRVNLRSLIDVVCKFMESLDMILPFRRAFLGLLVQIN